MSEKNQVIEIMLATLNRIDEKTDKHGEQLARIDEKLNHVVTKSECAAHRSKVDIAWYQDRKKLVAAIVALLGALTTACISIFG